MPLTNVDIVFWLGILRDHAIFIYNNLGPSETELARRAENMRNRFEELLKNPAGALPGEAIRATRELIDLKREILFRLLHCRVVIHLGPSDLNQMINEAREFLRVLGEIPPLPQGRPALLLHLLRLWLSDTATHSAMLYRVIDADEFRYLQELLNYERNFEMMFLKSIVKTQMYDKLNQDFPALYALVPEARQAVEAHIVLLNTLERDLQSCTVENAGMPLIPNHMIREETYFLGQLRQAMGD